MTYTAGPRSGGHASQELHGALLFWSLFMTILVIIQNNLGHCRDSKMRVLAQTTTFWPLLLRASAVDEN